MDPRGDKLRCPGLPGWLGAMLIAAAVAALFSLPTSALAQGFDWTQLLGGGGAGGNGGGAPGGGLPQFFGGGSGPGQSRNRPAAQTNGVGINVERSAPPFTGKFTGSQNDQGAQTTMTAQFACYLASDADIPQARTFVCYTAPAGQNGAANGVPSGYGPAPAAGPRYSWSGPGPAGGPPAEID